MSFFFKSLSILAAIALATHALALMGLMAPAHALPMLLFGIVAYLFGVCKALLPPGADGYETILIFS